MWCVQPQVRSATLAVIAIWVQQAGFLPFLEGEIISDSLKTENPYIKAEVSCQCGICAYMLNLTS